MPSTLLILACHGSDKEPSVNAGLRRRADALRSLRLFDDVVAVFKQGEPSFDSIIDDSGCDQVAVLPVTTSEGDFTTNYLPTELGRNRRYHRTCVEYLAPLGVQPGIKLIAANRLDHLVRKHKLSRAQVALVGHGTRRSQKSTESTERLAQQLGDSDLPAITGYLDDSPSVETIVERSRAETVMVIPFLIAAGPHATTDIPRRLGLSLEGETTVDQQFGRTRILVDRPLGADPAIDQLLATMAREAHNRLVKRASIVQHGHHD